MNEQNRKAMEQVELDYHGHLEYMEDNVAEIENIVSSIKKGDTNSDDLMSKLVQFIGNVR